MPKREKSAKNHALSVIDNRLDSLGKTRRSLADALDISEQALAGWWIRNQFPRERIEAVSEFLAIDPGSLAPKWAAIFRKGWMRMDRHADLPKQARR